MGGGSQRPFGNFPTIHPFWRWPAVIPEAEGENRYWTLVSLNGIELTYRQNHRYWYETSSNYRQLEEIIGNIINIKMAGKLSKKAEKLSKKAGKLSKNICF